MPWQLCDYLREGASYTTHLQPGERNISYWLKALRRGSLST